MKRFLLAALVSFALVLPAASAHTLTVRLVVNNTANTVYVPGIGEQPSSGISGQYANPPHFYLASYGNSFLSGLAARSGQRLEVGSGADSHYLELEQNLTGSRIYLAATQGDWNRIESRISLIEKGAFLSQISPSFAFSLGGLYPVKLLLKYPNMDLQGDFILGKGTHRLVIENLGVSAGRPVVQIRKA